MRIVYVEDNIANVHLVKRVARMGKHEVITYIDGMDAFNNFATDNPDLVLMDIQLAGELTGIEVVKKLRDKGFQTPIFAVTAYAMVGDRERCMEAGCTGYISKPIPIPDLVKLFEQYDKPEPPVVATIKLDKTVYDVNETKKLLSAKTFIEDNDKGTDSKKSEPIDTTKNDSSIDLAETKTLVAAKNIKSDEAKDDATVSQKSDNVDDTNSDISDADKVETQSAKPVSASPPPQDESAKPVDNDVEGEDITPVAEFDNDDTISINKDEPAQMI